MQNSDVLSAFTKTLVDFWAKIGQFKGNQGIFHRVASKIQQNVIKQTQPKNKF
jgi:hypothetical protein